MKFWIGICLIFIGAFFILDNINYFELKFGEYFALYWPSLFILWGAKKIFFVCLHLLLSLTNQRASLRYRDSFFWGLFILGFGLVMQGHNLEWFTLSWSLFWSWFWPILIIYLGFKILFWKSSYSFFSFQPKRKKSMVGSVHMGGTAWELEDQLFEHGIGSIDLDLSSAILKEGETELQFQCKIGEVTIKVPHDIPIKVTSNVKVGSTTIFGNHYDGIWRSASYIDPEYHLVEQKIYIDVSLSIGEVIIKRVD